MKRVYQADTLVDGQLVADWLVGNGIPCEIFHQNASGALGELPVTPPEVWIRRNDDSIRALKLLKEVVFVDDGEEKSCAFCHENSPAGFDICWHCQRSLD